MRKSPPGDGPGQLSRVCVWARNKQQHDAGLARSFKYIYKFFWLYLHFSMYRKGRRQLRVFIRLARDFFVLFYPAPNDNWWTRSHFHCIWWLMRNIVVVDTKTIRPRCPQGVVHIRKKEKIALHLHKYNFRGFFFKRCCTRNHRAAQKTKSSSAREARKCRLMCVDFHKTKQ